MDGVLVDLLNAKWNTFVKSKFYQQFYTFAFYFLITLVCFTLRPGPSVKTQSTSVNNTNNSILLQGNSTTTNLSINLNESLKLILTTTISSSNADDDDSEVEEWWDNLTEECRLMQLNSPQAKLRLAAEIFMVLGAFLYLATAVREARFLGGRMFFENLVKCLHMEISKTETN